MRSSYFAAAVALLCAAAPALAQDPVDASGFFVEVNGGAAFRSGTSTTVNGGRNNNGVVSRVSFSEAFAIGGQLGYRLNSAWSSSVSFDHVSGGVSWQTDYPLIAPGFFNGRAASNVLLGNVAYAHAIGGATSVELGAGAGVSINSLTGVLESSAASGAFAQLDAHTIVSPAARVSVGIEHAMSSQVSVGLGASLTYFGGFETGKAREFLPLPGSRQTIGPYRIDGVVGAAVTASLKASF